MRSYSRPWRLRRFGLWTSSMRMVGNGMMMVIPSSFDRRMFGDVASGADWLATQWPDAPDMAPAALAPLAKLLEKCTGACSGCTNRRD